MTWRAHSNLFLVLAMSMVCFFVNPRSKTNMSEIATSTIYEEINILVTVWLWLIKFESIYKSTHKKVLSYHVPITEALVVREGLWTMLQQNLSKVEVESDSKALSSLLVVYLTRALFRDVLQWSLKIFNSSLLNTN